MMTNRIVAFAGKGGTGKTTVASLTLRWLVKSGMTPVLAVDADPNSCFGETFGIENAETIGQVREKFAERKDKIPAGMSKTAMFQMMMHEIIVEKSGWDLLVMGRPEGPGCYCYANDVLRMFLETLSDNYKYIVIDQEAGMEHLSRNNAGKADFLFIVCEPTVSSLRAARRISALVDELGLGVGKRALVMNMVKNGESIEAGDMGREIRETGMEVAAVIPYDEELLKADLGRIPFMNIPDELESAKAARKLLDYIA